MVSRTINNPINIPYPFATTFGGTGVGEPTANGIMVANGASPMTPIVLESGQVLLGVTGGPPVPTTLTPATWGIVIDPVGPLVMTPFVTYVTTENDPAQIVVFNLPSSASLGDEFRVCCYGVDAIGFYIIGPDGGTDPATDTIWQGYDYTLQPARGVSLKADANPIMPTVASVHLMCVENTVPDAPMYLVISATGALSLGS